MLSMSISIKGLRRFDKEAKNSKIRLTLTVWTCLNRILADPNVSWWCHGKIRQWLQSVDATYIYSAVVIWCRWDSFNLRWRVAAAGWTFNHPRIHNRPSLPIRKHCGLPNTSILSCGTQLKISRCWRTSWWVLHSIKWSMSIKSQSWNDGTLSLGQSNPCYEKLSQCSSGGQLDVLVSADRGA